MRLLPRISRGAIRLPLWTTLLISVPFIAPLLSGCADVAPIPTSQTTLTNLPWTYADLRLMDPSDAPLPEQDLLAAYLRRSQSPSRTPKTRWEIRLDFLDMPVQNQTDLYLALDFTPSGANRLPFAASAALEWDVLIHISPSAPITALDSLGRPLKDLALLVQRDPAQASLVVSLDGTALYPIRGGAPPEIALQVFVVSPNTNQILDQTAPIRSFDAPPPPASLLLAFNQTFPAYTPAQALRRWDGAHTGPAGGRHGLGNLLRLARNRSIPLVLLDLGYPPWLPALDYAEGLNQVSTSLASGNLIIPNWTPPLGDPQEFSTSLWKMVQKHHLPRSQFGYAYFIPSTTAGSERLLFLPIRSESPVSTLYRRGQRLILPIPLAAADDPELQPDSGGLSLLSRRLLLETALNAASQPRPAPILVLGGDLTRSPWGIPDVARAAFAFIQNHPWIRPLSAYDLLDLPAASPLPELQPLYPYPPDAVARLPWELLLSSLPSDPLLEAARQAALTLTPPAPPNVPEFAALQEIYSRQVNILLAARSWAQNPQPAAACGIDLDLDGAWECLLASQNLYLVFEPDAGALTHAFWLASDGLHQFIAPSSQFSFGVSDPAAWDTSAALLADPTVIPGAFYDGAGAYQAQIEPGQLVLADPVRGLTKRFSLLPNGVRIEYRSSAPLVVRLPLALDPWRRFEPGWGNLYQGESNEEGWLWGIFPVSEEGQGFQVLVTTSGRLQVSAFNDTHALMGQLENPNAEFPPGHYLPFPIALAEISASGEFWLEATLSLK